MKSKSNLLNYISHLMQNDEALHKFTIDPITTSEKEHGLTKAERAVLRRTVHGLSNNSTNGYSIVRNLDSYRRSLRLLQNVLHNVGSKMVMDNLVVDDNMYTFTVFVYFPYVTEEKDANFTCRTNSYVSRFGGPYRTNYVNTFTATLNNPNPTIKEVMDNSELPTYQSVIINNEEFVKGFQVPAFYISADLSDERYNLSKNSKAHYVFWFYTINGTPSKGRTPHPGGTSGKLGESFATKKLKPNDVVYWQLIAPDNTYGFQHCPSHEQNEYAKTIRQKAK